MTIKYRIANRFRFTLFVVTTIIMLTLIANSILGLSTAAGSTIQEYAYVTVQSGDTLWSIAETYADKDSDIREAVYDICKLNDIKADQLKAGMEIQVPIY